MASTILLVEDDAAIASGLMYALEKEGYLPFHCKDVKTAFSAVNAKRFDLAILDMQLPDGYGTEVSDRLKNCGTPVIFLTIVDDENEIVHSFENGAADYITKPFRLRELLARVKRTLNAADGRERSQMMSLGNAVIDADSGKVYVDGTLIELTALEYRLLFIFAANKSILLTREQILEKIWDSSGHFVEDNTLTVYIKRVREKLGGAVNIQTVRGIGYRAD
ncbi:MAG: response regulator transcription factor [Lachnospiraceae bacterium]|nr:response regulator transcription factor [Lachnospiraceae bacterium]